MSTAWSGLRSYSLTGPNAVTSLRAMDSNGFSGGTPTCGGDIVVDTKVLDPDVGGRPLGLVGESREGAERRGTGENLSRILTFITSWEHRRITKAKLALALAVEWLASGSARTQTCGARGFGTEAGKRIPAAVRSEKLVAFADIERTKPLRATWPGLHKTFHKSILCSELRTNGHLTTWPDLGRSRRKVGGRLEKTARMRTGFWASGSAQKTVKTDRQFLSVERVSLAHRPPELMKKRWMSRRTDDTDFVAPASDCEGPSPQPSPGGRGSQYFIGAQREAPKMRVHRTAGFRQPLTPAPLELHRCLRSPFIRAP